MEIEIFSRRCCQLEPLNAQFIAALNLQSPGTSVAYHEATGSAFGSVNSVCLDLVDLPRIFGRTKEESQQLGKHKTFEFVPFCCSSADQR